MRKKPLQIALLASKTDKMVPGFSDAIYPDWRTLFKSLNRAMKQQAVYCLGEPLSGKKQP